MKIVFLDAYTTNPGDISFEPIKTLGSLEVYDRTDYDSIKERCSEAEIVIVNKFIVNEASLKWMQKVKYIVVAATGYNNIHLADVNKAGIPVSNVVGYSSESVAQHVFASILHITNQISYYNTESKNGRWASCEDFCFYDHSINDLSGLTLGIVGYGNIGKKVAEIGLAFGMNILVSTRNPLKDDKINLTFVSQDELFKKADIITLHCPLTEATQDIINKSNLSKMKKSAILINTGRGGLVNENDLFFALDHGIISGAALDVLKVEPPHISNPLVNHSKCIITPHIAWASRNARINLVDGLAENIKSYMNGTVINKVN